MPKPNPRLLIVDDQPAFGRFLRLIALKLGCDVRIIMNPREVESAVEAWRPAIIVLDIVMPEMDGFEIINLLAERRYDGYLILVSGNLSEYLEMAEKAARANGLLVAASLTKPVRTARLEATLRPLVAAISH